MAVARMNFFPAFVAAIPRPIRAVIAAMAVALIGTADFSTSEISFGVAYLIPIVATAWWVNMPMALILSVVSVGIWLLGDVNAGIEYSNVFASIWNYGFRLLFYCSAVYFIVQLKKLQNELEERVEERTAALKSEIGERERLEGELLQISEREQRRIGQDLHDGLCQHLTGTALAGQVLFEQLDQKNLSQAVGARKIVDLIEEAISLARRLAKGLHPVEMQADGLMVALDEFAKTTSELFNVACRFDCDSPVLIHNSVAAGHLYRIAQEAVSNAVKHGNASRIVIHLDSLEEGTALRVEDNGRGIPQTLPKGAGIGLQIMAHRAKMIGAKFQVESVSGKQTRIICVYPAERQNMLHQ